MSNETFDLKATHVSVEVTSEKAATFEFRDIDGRAARIMFPLKALRHFTTDIERLISQSLPADAEYRDLIVQEVVEVQVYDDGGCFVTVAPGPQSRQLRIGLPPGLGAALRDLLPADPNRNLN